MEENRSKRRWIWACAVLVVALLLLARVVYVFWIPDHRGTGRISIGRDTTRILTPVDPQGSIDYVAALNQRNASGIASGENAAVPIVRALGPEFVPSDVRPRVLAALGIEGLPEDGAYFVPRPAKAAAVPAELWSESKFPEIVEWLRANDAPLGLAKAAAERPRWFIPLVGDPPGAETAIVEAWSPEPEPIVELGEALVTRALGRASQGRFEEASSDLLVVHGLARHFARSPRMPLRLGGVGLEVLACKGDAALAAGGRLSEAQAREIGARLDGLGILADIARMIDEDERFACLSMALSYARADRAQGDGGEEDWDGILREINAWYDALVEAQRRPTFAERRDASRALREEVSRRSAASRGGFRGVIHTAIRGLIGGRDEVRRMRNRETADAVISLACGIVDDLIEFERAAVELDLARAAFALAAHKGARGAYPEDLARLVPEFAKAVPLDRSTGAALGYRRTEKGCTLSAANPKGGEALALTLE